MVFKFTLIKKISPASLIRKRDPTPNYFLCYWPFTLSLKIFPGTNLGSSVAGSWIVCPFAGFLPVRALRWTFENAPNPTNETVSPLATVSITVSRYALMTFSVSNLVAPDFSANTSISSVLSAMSVKHCHLWRWYKGPVRRTGYAKLALSFQI